MKDITYCSKRLCAHNECDRHYTKAPRARGNSYADLNDGCYEYIYRKMLLSAICKGTQKTSYKCTDACKAMCNNNGTCAYCSIIAESIAETFESQRKNWGLD